MNKLGSRSHKNIINLDSKLCILIGAVLSCGKVDFTITEGYRTVERQQELYSQGRSRSGNIVTSLDGVNRKSYHQTGKAIDFIPYPFKGWDDIESFIVIGEEFKRVGKLLGYDVRYGGDWKMKDYPHIEIR